MKSAKLFLALLLAVPFQLAAQMTIKANESPSGTTIQENTQTNYIVEESSTTQENHNSRQEEHAAGKGYGAYDFQLGLLDDCDGFLSTPISIGTSLRYSYFLHNNFYLSAGLGYLGVLQDTDRAYGDYSVQTHYITVPLRFGASINPNAKFDFIPNVGLNMNYCVVATTEMDNKKIDNELGGKMCVEGMIGARLSFNGFCITLEYDFPLNDNQEDIFGEDGYIKIGIGAGF